MSISGSFSSGVVEAVVRLGQAFVVSDHEVRAELVVVRAGTFEIGMRAPSVGEREGLEAVGGGVYRVVLHR